jgi:HK97 family phage portal protein
MLGLPSIFRRPAPAPVETKTAEPEERRALSDDLLAILGAVPTASNVSVTAITAMRVPAVANAVGLISEAVGNLPAKVYERLAEGGKEPAPDHPAYVLVHDAANPWTSAAALRMQLTADALLHGFGIAAAVKAGGRIVEFVRLEPQTVQVETDDLTSEPFFTHSANGTTRRYRYDEMLYIPAPNGAPIKLAREAIAAALVLERHVVTFFARGGRPDAVLRTDKKLGNEVVTRVGAAWRAAFGGGTSGGTPILEDGLQYQPVALNSVDSQLLQLRAFQILEIARAFRVSPIFLQEFGRATWSNSAEMGRQLVTYTLLPWLRAWTDAYARVLLTPEERATFSIEFVVDDLTRGDTAARATAYSQFRAAGVYTSNELRVLENLPAHPDGNKLDNPNTTPAATPAKPAAPESDDDDGGDE